MTYNSAFWYPAGIGIWTPTLDGGGNPTFGWSIQGTMGTVGYQTQVLPSCGYNVKYSNFTYTDTSGTVHPFSFTVYSSSSCGSTSGSGAATDNSNYQLLSTAVTGGVSSSVFFPNGLGQTDTKLTDMNGNYITKTVSGSETDWTDTVGRTALKVNTGSSTTTYKWLDPTGAYQTTTVVYSSFNVKSNFGCGWVEYSGTANLPTEIDLPNGNKYLFTYEPTPGYPTYTTGRVQKVTLPAGGYYQYSFAPANDGINCDDGTFLGLTRTINDGTNSVQWSYDRSTGSTIVTAPQMPYASAPNQSKYVFGGSLQQETQEKHYQGSVSGGTLLKTIDKTLDTNGFPATKVTTLDDTNQESEIDTTYDSHGNLTKTVEYDWGTSGHVGGFLRETDMTYASAVYPPFPMTQKLLKDAGGTIKYREDRVYDGITLVSVTGANQHDDTNYGTSNGYRLNLTSVATYSNPATPSGGLKSTFTYNTVGNLLTASSGTTSSVVQQKQYTYSSTTQYAAPDSITSGPSGGPQLTTSYTYNAYTGQTVSVADPNGQTTTYYYDAYKRPTSVTRPDGAQMTTSYNDSAFTVTSSAPIDSTPHKRINVAAYDGLGRQVTGTLEDYGSTVYSITQTQYDPLGRPYKASNPYTSSPAFWTTAEFDALGRSVATILPDGSQTTLSYSGNMATATDPSGMQRKTYFDVFGRVIEVDEPSGTVTLAAGSGSGTVGGTEQHHNATSATAGVGTVSIGGSEQTNSVDNPYQQCMMYDCGGDCFEWQWVDDWTTYYDQGTVSIAVNGHSDSVTYGSSSSASSIASGLATAINADSGAYATASASGVVVTLTAKTTGTASDLALASASVTTDTTGNFYSASFWGSSGNVLTGGAPATSASYDSGTVSITVDGDIISVPYTSSSTANSIAAALISAVNSTGSLHVTASGTGAGIILTANTSGAATNYSISSASSTSQPTLFSSPSFSIPAFGPALTGGVGPDSWASPVSTTYTYNMLNNLTGVSQGSQTRSYTYDGLGRATSSSIPETTSGGTQHTSYSTYDSDSSCSTPNSFPGQLISTVDARGVRTCMQYDTLRRVTGTNYTTVSGVTGTSSVSYSYGTSSSSNNNGRLVGMSDGTGSESYTYDILGRTTESDKVVGTTTYPTDYAYNLAGEPTQITYPSGRIVKQNYDPFGRLCSVTGSATGCSPSSYYVSSYTYNTAQQGTGFRYGNSVTAAYNYSSDRLQLSELDYQVPAGLSSMYIFHLGYLYGPAGSNNGQITGITDELDNGRSVSYTYDGLGRLSTAATVGSSGYPAWGLSWTYDRYGNLTQQNVTAGSGYSSCLAVSVTTNQITGTCANNPLSSYSYDANGNMLGDGVNTMTYDAASRLISSSNGTSSGAYSYDGNGIRVKKATPASSPTTTTVYIFSGGKVIAEYDNGAAVGSPSREYIYSGATQIAKITGGTTTYYHQDHLSNRLITSSSGGVVEQMGHFPFGDNWYDTGSEKWKFTTYERDAESGNDYAMARYNASRLGRFTSPDPLSGSVGNPQSLNHYIYAGNDPVNLFDPTGLASCDSDNPPPVCTMEIETDGGGTGWDIDGNFSDPGRVDVLGYDIFDALDGAAGTFLHEDIYGNLSYGFSTSLYDATIQVVDHIQYALDNGIDDVDCRKFPCRVYDHEDLTGHVSTDSGWQVMIEDWGGGFSSTSGIIPEMLILEQHLKQDQAIGAVAWRYYVYLNGVSTDRLEKAIAYLQYDSSTLEALIQRLYELLDIRVK